MREENKEIGLFCECKWANEKVKAKVLKDLIRKSENFGYLKKFYFIFSKSGFTDGLIEMAKDYSNVYLITLDKMIALFEEK